MYGLTGAAAGFGVATAAGFGVATAAGFGVTTGFGGALTGITLATTFPFDFSWVVIDPVFNHLNSP